MTSAIKNVLIGIFVLIALAMIVFILLFLHPSVGDNAKTLHVRFTDIDKINVGTRVTYAGKPVGEVVQIREIPEARVDRVEHNGNVYVYELTLKVDSGVNVYNTDEISIHTSGLLGERNIDITPFPLKPGETLYLMNNETIYASTGPSVEETLKQFGQLSKKIDILLENVNGIIEDVKNDQIVSKISRTAQNVLDITDSLNQPDRLRKIVDNFWDLSNRAHRSWDTVDQSLNNIYALTHQAHGTLNTIDEAAEHVKSISKNARESWKSIDQTLSNFHLLSKRVNHSWLTVDDTLHQFHAASLNTNAFTEQIKQIINYVGSGQGTIGHLFIGNDLYLRLKSILHKGQVVADDINHFGLLFHLNKEWQRLNARRLKLLQRLSTPTQFANYFNRQLDEIQTSLSGVSVVLDETACYPQSLLHDPTFTKRFGDLIKKVEAVEDSLKMYNEQVVDQEINEEQNQGCY
jgi:phospholipid/cholesterol/gamma-HCH transport system substrate-binding protein